MRAHSQRAPEGAIRGFTLVEVIAGLAVLTLLGCLLMHLVSRMAAQTDGVRRHAETRLAARPVMARLVSEIAAAASLPGGVKALSFSSGVEYSRLALAVPRAAVRQESAGGGMALVIYEWEARTGNLIRAECHPSTLSDSGGGEGMQRLLSLAPSLSGTGWQSMPAMEEALRLARRHPILTNVLSCEFHALEHAGDRPATGRLLRSGSEPLPAAVAVTLRCAVDAGGGLSRDPSRGLPFTTVVSTANP